MSAARKLPLKEALVASLAAEDAKAASEAVAVPRSFYVQLLTAELEPRLPKGASIIIDPTRPLTDGCFAYGVLRFEDGSDGGAILFHYHPTRHDGAGHFCKAGADNEEIGSVGGLRLLRSDIANGTLTLKGVAAGWIMEASNE